MTVLVLGKSGQLARALAGPGVTCLGRDEADLANPEALPDVVAKYAPTAVINAAAYTAVDAAETDEAAANVINADAPGVLAGFCAQRDIPFVHVSTDYVFDGSGHTAWTPDAPINPLGAYGRSKAAGEALVHKAGGRAVVLRTSAVFSATGSNFLKTMLRLGQTRDVLNIVSDQVTGPTPADGLAAACLAIADALVDAPDKAGTFHFCGQPFVSWADFARAIFAAAKQDVQVNDIPSSAYPTPAKRPMNARLDCTSLTQTFGITPPSWRIGMEKAVELIMQEDLT